MSTIDKLIKRQIKLTILSVIAVVLITSTITYALYQTNHENTTDQVISIGNLGLTATGTPITLEGLYPMEEYDLTSSYPSYNFTLENKTNNVNNDYTLMYELILRADENTTLTQDDYQYIMYKIDGSESKLLSESWDSEINGFKILDGRLLSHEETTLATSLANKDKENHSIVFWLSTYSPNSVQGKTLTLKMSLEAYADRFNYLKYYAYADNNVFGKTLNRSDFESITTLDKIEIPDSAIDSWDVSQRQNKSIMAWYTDEDNNGLYELYLGQFGGVIANPSCANLFRYTSNVIINLNKFDTSLVTSMYAMFGGEWSDKVYKVGIKEINGIENLNTSNVTNLNKAFFGTQNLKSLDLSKWDTSNVTTMYFTFCYSGIESIDLNNWNTSQVTTMERMFGYCSSLKSLDISSFDTSKVTNVAHMFIFCDNLSYINVENAIFSSVTYSTYMFTYGNYHKIIVTNECAKEFVRARTNNTNSSLEVAPCVKVCYSNNINNLPSEYTELEYIESTGTQYIDTGVKANNVSDIKIKFNIVKKTGSHQGIIGGGWSQNNGTFQIVYGNDTNTIISKYGSATYTITNDYQVHNYEISNSFIKVDDATVAHSNSITDNRNTVIFARHNDNSAAGTKEYAAIKLYSCQIYESGTLVRNYVPALRNSDSAIGLYETEEGRFYENSGTGVFNSNGGMQIKTGNTIHLISTISARPGYTFVGWNTKPDGTGTTFKQGEVVDASVLKSLGEDTITLYAMWEAN